MLLRMCERETLQEPEQTRILSQSEHQKLPAGVNDSADELLRGRHQAVQRMLDVAHGAVAVGHHPRRRALEDVELLHRIDDLGHVLDG